MANNGQQQKPSVPALAKQHVAAVEQRVMEMEQNKQIHLPENYSAPNALRSAFLHLQEVTDRNNRPALEVCSQASITNALLRMVIQGLSPDKKQCYYLVYGNQLVCQRSYHGTMAVARMVNPKIQEDGFSYAVVYEDDDLTYEIKRGKPVIQSHKQKLENIDKNKIVAAYCEIYDSDDRLLNSELMTMDQIKQAWKQSPIKPVNDDGTIKATSTHGKFTADMALKTVIGKACKPIINSSDDKTLLEAANHSEQVKAEETANQTALENENQDYLDVASPEPPTTEMINTETGEIVDAEWSKEDEQENEHQQKEPELAMAGAEDDPGF